MNSESLDSDDLPNLLSLGTSWVALAAPASTGFSLDSAEKRSSDLMEKVNKTKTEKNAQPKAQVKPNAGDTY